MIKQQANLFVEMLKDYFQRFSRKNPEIIWTYKISSKVFFGIMIILSVFGAWGEGHFFSWLTFPIIAICSLLLFRDLKRSLFVTLAMSYEHEFFWYVLGTSIFGTIEHYKWTVDFSNTEHNLFFFIIWPIIFVPTYFLYVRPKYFWLQFLFIGYMIIWDLLGFPSNVNVNITRFQYLATPIEILSWWFIFSCYLAIEILNRKYFRTSKQIGKEIIAITK